MVSGITRGREAVSNDEYHETKWRAQVYSSSRSRDQVLVFDWIACSYQVNLL